jgi:hypothetical protein
LKEQLDELKQAEKEEKAQARLQAGRNHKIFGIGYHTNAEGKMDKLKLPFMKYKRGADGKMHINRVSVAGMKFKRNDKDGTFFFKDFSLLGMHREAGADGKIHLTGFGGLIRREAGEDGKYRVSGFNLLGLVKSERQKDGKMHLTSLGFGLGKASHERGADGKSHVAGVRICGFNFYSSGRGKTDEERGKEKETKRKERRKFNR